MFSSSLFAVHASATTPSTSADIVEFLESMDQTVLAETRTQFEQENHSIDLADTLVEAVFNADPDSLETALNALEGQAIPDEAEWDSVYVLAWRVHEALEASDPKRDGLLEALDLSGSESDWYARSVAQSLSGYVYVTRHELIVAARHVDDAMGLIPTELSEAAKDARLLASEVAMVLHGTQGNPGFMLEAAKTHYEMKRSLGETVNRHELMTNFVYALNRVRDFEGAARVSILLRAEPQPDTFIGSLANTYMAQTYNEIREYETARDLAASALAQSDHPVVQTRGHYNMIVALAGLGEEGQARTIMREKDWIYSSAILLSETREEAVLHAEALLAMNRGDAAFALALMKRRADLLVSRVQAANSTDMTAMLSNLENTRGRQEEREGALRREAELKALQLEQQTKMNRMLWALIAVLAIAFNLLLVFLRYREKTNRKVHGLQTEALSAEKMKTEFLGVVNHELRTPLNGIIGISDAMIHHAKDPMMKAQAQAVQQSGQLLFDLLDSLITMSTIEGNRLTLDSEDTVLSKELAREIGEWVDPAERKGLIFTSHVDEALDQPVLADAAHLRKSLKFLLSNAVRFTHTGRIHVHATAETVEQTHLSVTLIVADTGQGISEEVQSRLFKPFLQADSTMTRKYGGAGLSLAIARKLSRMMGGDLRVNSREGRGSEFIMTVELPLAEKAISTPAYPETEAGNLVDNPTQAKPSSGLARLPADRAPITVPTLSLEHADTPEEIIDLMLDHQLFDPSATTRPMAQTPRHKPFSLLFAGKADSPERRICERKDANCTCRTVTNTTDLLRALKGERFEAVLLDLSAEHINAVETVQKIRSLNSPSSRIPIIALTTPQTAGHGSALIAAGADMFLSQPVDPVALEAAIIQFRTDRSAA